MRHDGDTSGVVIYLVGWVTGSAFGLESILIKSIGMIETERVRCICTTRRWTTGMVGLGYFNKNIIYVSYSNRTMNIGKII